MVWWRLNPCYHAGVQRSRTVARVGDSAIRLTVLLHQHLEDVRAHLEAEWRNVSEKGETWHLRELAYL